MCVGVCWGQGMVFCFGWFCRGGFCLSLFCGSCFLGILFFGYRGFFQFFYFYFVCVKFGLFFWCFVCSVVLVWFLQFFGVGCECGFFQVGVVCFCFLVIFWFVGWEGFFRFQILFGGVCVFQRGFICSCMEFFICLLFIFWR